MEGGGGWRNSRTKPGRARVYSLGHGLSYSAINVDGPAPGALTCRYYMPHGRSPACARPSPPRSGRSSAPLGLCSSVAAGNGHGIVTSGDDGGAIAERCTEARPSTSSLSVRLLRGETWESISRGNEAQFLRSVGQLSDLSPAITRAVRADALVLEFQSSLTSVNGPASRRSDAAATGPSSDLDLIAFER